MTFGKITQIDLTIWTTDASGASTSGRVYFGAAGREYAVKSAHDSGNDFTFNAEGRHFAFGDKDHSTVARWQDNDPASPFPSEMAEVPHQPTYLRLVPNGVDDNWHIARADVKFTYQPTVGSPRTQEFHRMATGGQGGSIWLGVQRGLYLYFLTANLFDE